ncbi:MAG: MBOAT family protein [Verrucomicrobiota bacterium]
MKRCKFPRAVFYRRVPPEKLISLPWVEMWLLVSLIFFTAKFWVLHADGKRGGAWDKTAFLLFWPGMNFREFVRKPAGKRPLVLRGCINLAIGIVLTWFVARHVPHRFFATWIAMIGFIWALHGGVITLAAAFWRWRGRDVNPLMFEPLLATSLADFWGRRWNRAFRDFSHRFLFQPTVGKLGARGAMLVVFFISGLLHEVVVTVPARGGYGLPTLYYLLQGIGMIVETRLPARSLVLRRLFAFVVLVVPLSLGFPAEFVRNVAEPFFRSIHALS